MKMRSTMNRFLRMYLPMAIILLALCYSFYHLSSRDFLNHAELEDISLTQQEQQLLHDDFQGFASDLITFANLQEWRFAFHDANKEEIDELVEEFKILIATKGRYEKIRLLDLKGKELLRVELHQDRAESIPTHKLQDKSHRYYLAACQTLSKNQIYISPLDLNWENGTIERPLEPVIRLITPIYDGYGKKRGLLVLNVLAETMLQRFMAKHADAPKRSLLVTQQGNWLHDGKLTATWDFLLPDQPIQQFKDEFPQAWQHIHQYERGQFTNKAGLFTYATVNPSQAAYDSLPDHLRFDSLTDEDNKQQIWKIIQFRSSNELVALTMPLTQRIGGYTALFLLLLIPLIWRMTLNAARREKSEVVLRQSEHKFRHLVDDLSDGVVVLAESKVMYANQAAIRIFGEENSASMLGNAVMDYVHPESQQLVIQRMQAVMDGETLKPAEEHLLTRDGSDVFAFITPTKIEFEGQPAIQSIIHNMTDQRMLEGTLHLSRQRHELYVTQTHLAVIEWDVDFTVVSWNHGAEVVFGYAAEHAIGKHATELLLTENQQSVVNEIWQQLLTTKSGRHSINENITSDGHIITCEWHNTPLIRKDGKVIGVTSLCRDISKEQRQKMELNRLQQAIEHAGESFMITDADANIEYVNPAFSEITGYAAEEVLGKTPKMLNSGRQDDRFYQNFWQKIKSGETWHGSLIDKRKDGSLYPALMSVAPVFDDNGIISYYISIQQDMSEHEELEGKFRQAQKMEALGTLVGGIAHDFNNVLAGMLGNLYLVKKKTTANADVQIKLKRIEDAGYRAAEMIKQLLTFARKGESELSPLWVQPFIKEILKLAHSAIPENIELLSDLGKQDYQIMGDASQIQQMMLNLIVNASHALEGMGKPVITVSMCMFDPDDGFLFIHRNLDDKPLLRITVSDNGCGISKANIDKVFEPFFTTKEEGKGTGLGLAMVYGSMQNHGGAIDVESEEGQGTCMNLYFSLCDSEKVSEEKEPVEVTDGMGETILLVDDNESVREAMQEVLQDFGYRVLVAENGQQALLKFVDHASEIKLALLDIVMPVMGGIEAAEKICKLQPDLPILFLSGYDKGVSPVDKPKVQDIAILTKPIDLAELSHQIRKILNK